MGERDEEVGGNVRRIRESRGMSQADLADAMADWGLSGFYPQTILKIEKGTRALKLHEALPLASALGVSTTDLVHLPEHLTTDGEIIRAAREVERAFGALHESVAGFLEAKQRLADVLQDAEPSSEPARKLAHSATRTATLNLAIQVGKETAAESSKG